MNNDADVFTLLTVCKNNFTVSERIIILTCCSISTCGRVDRCCQLAIRTFLPLQGQGGSTRIFVNLITGWIEDNVSADLLLGFLNDRVDGVTTITSTRGTIYCTLTSKLKEYFPEFLGVKLKEIKTNSPIT